MKLEKYEIYFFLAILASFIQLITLGYEYAIWTMLVLIFIALMSIINILMTRFK